MSLTPSATPLSRSAILTFRGLPSPPVVSTIFPAWVQLVKVSETVLSALGWSLPLPLARTLEARPDAVFAASAGALPTSGGAGASAGLMGGGGGSTGRGGTWTWDAADAGGSTLA